MDYLIIYNWADTQIQRNMSSVLRAQAEKALKAYFSRPGRMPIPSLPLHGTPFERSVWRALRRIPFGSTVTYGQLAERIGHPRAALAVGTAVRKNPFPVLIPCHRVVPAAGGIGRFAGGSAKKRWLLRYEQAL